MIVTATARQLEAQPLTPGVVCTVLDRLGAEDRAALAWAPTELRNALQSLQQDALTPQVLGKATADYVRVCRKLVGPIRRLAEQLGQSPIGLVKQAWKDQLPRIRQFLPEGPWEAFDWVQRATFAVGDLPEIDQDEALQMIAEATESELEAFAHSPAGTLTRAQALLSAASDLAERQIDAQRAGELAEAAFLEAVAGVRLLEAAGMHVDPFQDETTEEKAERARRYATQLAQEIGDEELETIEEARLRVLR